MIRQEPWYHPTLPLRRIMQQPHPLISAICLLLLLLGACQLLAPTLRADYLVQSGSPAAEIVIREDSTRSLRFAAEELQAHIELISGAQLPIVTTPSATFRNRIFVGESQYTRELGISANDLQHGAFHIASGDNWLALVGNDTDFVPSEPWVRNYTQAERERVLAEWDALTGEGNYWGTPNLSLYREYSSALDLWEGDQRGSLNAVYALLYELGMRWYYPGELGKIMPDMPDIRLPQLITSRRPDFDMRSLWVWGNPFVHANAVNPAVLDQIRWELWLGTTHRNGVFGPGKSGHGGIAVHSREEVKAAQLEYFALWGGKRATEHLSNYGAGCLSHPGLIDANVRYARFMFDSQDAPSISAAPADGYTRLCECELCVGKANPDLPYQGYLSNYVWGYINTVAQQVYETHPDRMITGVAYSRFLLPPDNIETLSPNVAVGFCYWRSQFHDAGQRNFYRELIQQWLEITPSGQFFVWDYYLHGRPGGPYHGVPVYFMNLIADDITSLKGISRGDYIEVYGRDGAMAFNHLNCYVTLRLLWDADLDLDALLEEYYRKFYGPAACEMQAFIEYAEVNWPAAMGSVEVIDTMSDLLHRARSTAGDTVYGQRIQLLVDYMRAIEPLRYRLAMNRGDNPKVRVNFRNRQTHPLVLDGVLDDPFWESIPLFFHLRDAETGEYPAERTSFRARWADNSLFLGIHCREPEARKRAAQAATSGANEIFENDHLVILLETQTHSFYKFVISPSGEFLDFDMKGGDANSQWSAGAEVVTGVDDDSWSVEIHLPLGGPNVSEVDPLNGIEGSRPTASRPWFINVIRVRNTKNDPLISSFSPLKSPTLDDPTTFGEVFTP